MPLDAGLVMHITKELNSILSDGKVEKIYQPSNDETILLINKNRNTYRLLINTGSVCPRINISDERPENPKAPPMFCMLLRKYLSGSVIKEFTQLGFDRIIRITFNTYDDLGFYVSKHLIIELMGRYCNLIFTDENDKILGASRIIEFSKEQKRPVLPGLTYTLPPAQNKTDITIVDINEISELLNGIDSNMGAKKALISLFSGISPSICESLVYMSCKNVNALMGECREELIKNLADFSEILKNKMGEPYLIKASSGKYIDYSFIPLMQYSTDDFEIKKYDTFNDLIYNFYKEIGKADRQHKKVETILKSVKNIENRINKKIELQKKELIEAENSDEYKTIADLITANIYLLKKGMKNVRVPNYFSNKDEIETVTVILDEKLTPSQNAQKYYKKYNKAKNAKIHLTEQIEKANQELEYIYTVEDSLKRAYSDDEIEEIRTELYNNGYSTRFKNQKRKKQGVKPKYIQYETSNGFKILCGKNNTSNDYITNKLANKTDWWFHVKNAPGSHVVMISKLGEEPIEEDFTQAAIIAAVNSSLSESDNVPVDYTNIKKVKKPIGAKPGFVIYNSNWTALVTPNHELEENLKIK